MDDGKLIMPDTPSGDIAGKRSDVIDVQVDEARRLAKLEAELNRKFVGMPKDLRIWAQLRDELTTKAAELGFKIHLDMQVVGENWIPVCSIVGRTDMHLQEILNTEGPDIEHKVWDSKRVSSAELRQEGVNPELL